MTEDIFDRVLNEHGIVAADPMMRTLYQKSIHLAETDVGILLYGESGVGKDRLAKFIHEMSLRHSAPFIHINCGAIPHALFESELFGYEAGTFTGGLNQGKRGLLESAQNGTLFLDEVGEMSLSNQVKLLDFLQTKQIARLGGTRKKLDVRIISATNRDLKACVAAGAFREDLLYRLCVVVLDIPALRNRPADIAAFAQTFLARNYPDRRLCSDAISFLQSCNWPGNLRELNNYMEKICVLTDERVFTSELLKSFYQETTLPELQKPTHNIRDLEHIPTLREAMNQYEKDYILQAIAQTSTLGEAAIRLGIDLDTLNRKKRQYGIYKRWKR